MKFFSQEFICPCDLVSRNASNFVFALSKVDFDVWLESESKRVNAKSLIGVMSLMLRKNNTIGILATGQKENLEIVYDILNNI